MVCVTEAAAAAGGGGSSSIIRLVGLGCNFCLIFVYKFKKR